MSALPHTPLKLSQQSFSQVGMRDLLPRNASGPHTFLKIVFSEQPQLGPVSRGGGGERMKIYANQIAILIHSRTQVQSSE